MPRQNRFKVIKGGPQGDDAEVTVFVPTVGELNRYLKMLPQEPPNGKLSLDELDATNEITSKFVQEHVKKWNWANADGEPFTLPVDMEMLLPDEQQFLINAVIGTTADQVEAQKNLKK